jgi:hypothetical protein
VVLQFQTQRLFTAERGPLSARSALFPATPGDCNENTTVRTDGLEVCTGRAGPGLVAQILFEAGPGLVAQIMFGYGPGLVAQIMFGAGPGSGSYIFIYNVFNDAFSISDKKRRMGG